MVKKNKFNPQCITPSQMKLIFNVRVFFLRFTIWIRAYIISRYTGVGTSEELFGRLYLESTDFGDIFHVLFGRETADEFAQHLNQISIALRALIDDQLAKNSSAIAADVNSLYKAADDLAAFLASVSPSYHEAEWKRLWETYITLTLEMASSFEAGHYERDIDISDQLARLAETMGYLFAQALYDYMTAGTPSSVTAPAKGEQCLTLEQVNEIYTVRMIWFDLSIWTRAFMLSKFKGIGDVNQVHDRLSQVPQEFVNSIQKIFGENPEFYAKEKQLLNTYVDLIDSLTTAQMKGNTAEVNRVVKLLYQNADERAASFASLAPSLFSEEELRSRLYDFTRSTIEESTTLLEGDYARNLDVFDTILNEAESLSGYLTSGLVSYLLGEKK